MSKTVQQLQNLMVDQLKRRGFYPKEELSYEVVDVFWNILRFCELKKIDLEKTFIDKLEKNEKRSLAKQVNDISENS